MNPKKLFWTVLACISLGIGAVAAAIPLLPSFPFLLLAAFSFGKSSERLNRWFIGTRIYKNNLESYVKGKGMTKGAKIRLVITLTLFMGIGLAVMIPKALYIPSAILGVVWFFHIVYFMFVVKTYTPGNEDI